MYQGDNEIDTVLQMHRREWKSEGGRGKVLVPYACLEIRDTRMGDQRNENQETLSFPILQP